MATTTNYVRKVLKVQDTILLPPKPGFTPQSTRMVSDELQLCLIMQGLLGKRGVDWMNYFDHWNVARAAWLKHYEECAIELGLDLRDYLGDERRWADESWQESEQIKILHNGTIKIKWEHTCWWADCKHPVFHGQYYAILAGLDQITWEEPYDRAKRLQEESE